MSERRVLVAERNQTSCEVIAAQLRAAGYSVTTASNAFEAMAQLQQALACNLPFVAALIDARLDAESGAGVGLQIHGDPLLTLTHTVMLTSIKNRPEPSELSAKGFEAYVTKPIRARELLSCLDLLLAKNPLRASAEPLPLTTIRALESNHVSACSGKVLLVEDNAVNQKVAQRFLERLGCHVTIADNGAKAVAAYTREHFDLILMDLQMPVMDGYVATQEIRINQRGPRVPIIALTANAMTGQLERCLAANMDGLLTKPISADRLRQMLERFGLGREEKVKNVG
jgi:CheY-like chemotaxis protein